MLAVAIAGAVFVIGRGNSATTSNATGRFGAPPGNEGDFQAFQQCLAKNGVTLTQGQRPDFNDPAVQKAMQACRSLLPQRPNGFGHGGHDDNGPVGTPQNGRPVAPSTTTTTGSLN